LRIDSADRNEQRKLQSVYTKSSKTLLAKTISSKGKKKKKKKKKKEKTGVKNRELKKKGTSKLT